MIYLLSGILNLSSLSALVIANNKQSQYLLVHKITLPFRSERNRILSKNNNNKNRPVYYYYYKVREKKTFVISDNNETVCQE